MLRQQVYPCMCPPLGTWYKQCLRGLWHLLYLPVRVTSGSLSEPTRSEIEALLPQELADGWRLAYQATPTSDCKLVLPPESMNTSLRVYLEGLEVIVPPELHVKAYHLQMTAPSLFDYK